ncbi:aminotransferase, class IV [Bacteriovorax sp. BSW11_IV]|uniref:aminotransferase class IV n=1 Tax=Bacteriovorax sp. BSW11_IV TaxID=1353529 RepID=UPI00038A2233|nr:aminotransferase class IV [Bacteriovorax sp. BSW11_IV]EQC50079.1 aminotransferase, class IV [Bacteriovorax sp. BSW11_IV]
MNSKGKVFFRDSWQDVDQAFGPLANRGFLFGESLFTTTRISQNKIFFLTDHLQRLKNGVLFLYGEEVNVNSLQDFVTKAIAQVISDDSYYLRISYLRKLSGEGEFFLFLVPFVSDPRRLRASKAISRKGVSLVPEYLKAGNYLETNIELQSAAKNNFDEVIFYSTDDILLEASTSNIFLIQENQILTPKIQSGILEGIARKHLIEFLKSQNYVVIERLLTEDDLLASDEVWLSNSLRFLRCLESYESREFKDDLYNTVLPQFLKFIGQ